VSRQKGKSDRGALYKRKRGGRYILIAPLFWSAASLRRPRGGVSASSTALLLGGFNGMVVNKWKRMPFNYGDAFGYQFFYVSQVFFLFGITEGIAVPDAPARPVLPIRCT